MFDQLGALLRWGPLLLSQRCSAPSIGELPPEGIIGLGEKPGVRGEALLVEATTTALLGVSFPAGLVPVPRALLEPESEQTSYGTACESGANRDEGSS